MSKVEYDFSGVDELLKKADLISKSFGVKRTIDLISKARVSIFEMRVDLMNEGVVSDFSEIDKLIASMFDFMSKCEKDSLEKLNEKS